MSLTSNTAGEKTAVFDKFEEIVACALEILEHIRTSHDLCLDRWGPSAVLGAEVIKNAFIAVHNRGAKIRLITEISEENVVHCKEFMKFAELRHLANVKGNFSVSDGKWYTGSALAEKDKPPPRLIYSSVKEIAVQHQYFFETLWDKATPAVQRIAEMEGKAVPEKTEIVYGEANSINLLIHAMERTRKEALACSSSVVPVFCMTVEPAKKIIMDTKERGVKSRQITEINKQNVSYCKEFMQYVELRHLDNVQGNMLITDNDEYVATATVSSSSVPQAIHSTAKVIVQQQRLFFENLWSRSIPAEQRIREIELGLKPISVEILSSNQESAARGFSMVQNAKEQVLLLFPAANILKVIFDLRISDMYNEAAKRGIAVNILVKESVDAEAALNAARKQMNPSIQFRIFHDEMKDKGIRMAILVVDNKEVIVWNMIDTTTTDLYHMAGNAIYSSNLSVVSSYRAIFSSLWKQVEMYEQISKHDQIQTEFVNIAAHELRTPIQPLLGTAELLETNLKGQNKIEVAKDDIDLIIRNARRLERLSSDILTVSRIESRSLELNKEMVNLEEKIRNVIRDSETYIKNNKELKIVFEPGAEPVVVEADRSKLFEVLSNILRNAIKFTRSGTITASLKKQNGQAVISIRDTGTGIDSNIMPILFEKFATRGGSIGGTGLGLFISKSIVEAHGGKIWAENNKDGKGATVTFTLPLESRVT